MKVKSQINASYSKNDSRVESKETPFVHKMYKTYHTNLWKNYQQKFISSLNILPHYSQFNNMSSIRAKSQKSETSQILENNILNELNNDGQNNEGSHLSSSDNKQKSSKKQIAKNELPMKKKTNNVQVIEIREENKNEFQNEKQKKQILDSDKKPPQRYLNQSKQIKQPQMQDNQSVKKNGDNQQQQEQGQIQQVVFEPSYYDIVNKSVDVKRNLVTKSHLQPQNSDMSLQQQILLKSVFVNSIQFNDSKLQIQNVYLKEDQQKKQEGKQNSKQQTQIINKDKNIQQIDIFEKSKEEVYLEEKEAQTIQKQKEMSNKSVSNQFSPSRASDEIQEDNQKDKDQNKSGQQLKENPIESQQIQTIIISSNQEKSINEERQNQNKEINNEQAHDQSSNQQNGVIIPQKTNIVNQYTQNQENQHSNLQALDQTEPIQKQDQQLKKGIQIIVNDFFNFIDEQTKFCQTCKQNDVQKEQLNSKIKQLNRQNDALSHENIRQTQKIIDLEARIKQLEEKLQKDQFYTIVEQQTKRFKSPQQNITQNNQNQNILNNMYNKENQNDDQSQKNSSELENQEQRQLQGQPGGFNFVDSLQLRRRQQQDQHYDERQDQQQDQQNILPQGYE